MMRNTHPLVPTSKKSLLNATRASQVRLRAGDVSLVDAGIHVPVWLTLDESGLEAGGVGLPLRSRSNNGRSELIALERVREVSELVQQALRAPAASEAA